MKHFRQALRDRARWHGTSHQVAHRGPDRSRCRRLRGLKSSQGPPSPYCEHAMQFSNEGLTSDGGSPTEGLIGPNQEDATATRYSAWAVIQPATALPISEPESSWIKCEPLTVTSRWFFQLRQNSLISPIRIAPGSAFTNSFGRSF